MKRYFILSGGVAGHGGRMGAASGGRSDRVRAVARKLHFAFESEA